jgi:ribonuclease HI
MTTEHVEIYTDGGCDPNPGVGGWAAILRDAQGRESLLSGADPHTTNNRMELTAAIEALRALKAPTAVDLYTDSTYLMKGITEWMPKWLAKNWRGSSGPVLNVDLWKKLLVETECHSVNWHWVKGHAGNRYNQRVDALVHAARRNLNGK